MQLPFQLLRQQYQTLYSVICGILIAKDFHSITFATVNGVGQSDVNILAVVKHKNQANATRTKQQKELCLRIQVLAFRINISHCEALIFKVHVWGHSFNGDNIKIIHFLNKHYENDFALAYDAFILEEKLVNMVKTFIKSQKLMEPLISLWNSANMRRKRKEMAWKWKCGTDRGMNGHPGSL